MARLLVSGVVVATLIAVMTPAPAGAITYDKLAYSIVVQEETR